MSGPAFLVRETAPAERGVLRGLLTECRLPEAGFGDPGLRVWAAYAEGGPVGIAGLERYGDQGLLRSVATRAAWRGRGVAGALVGRVAGEAAAAGVRRLWLLTETAEGFFRRQGFQTVPRGAADPRLAASQEFQGGHCVSAVLMVRSVAWNLTDGLRGEAAGGGREASMDPIELKGAVREHYAKAARGERPCCPDPGGLGYGREALESVPGEVRAASLGCGSPVEAARLRPGERVLDLGSGAGLDLLLAAQAVGSGGRVYGVDMTPEMIERSRSAAAAAGADNVTVLRGEIEELPLPDDSVDVVVSNCVINLSPDKPRVFREALRVLAPGGRFVVADMLASAPLPAAARGDAEAWSACIAGAITEPEYVGALHRAGFERVEVQRLPGSERSCCEAPADAGGGAAAPAAPVFSAVVRAYKPA